MADHWESLSNYIQSVSILDTHEHVTSPHRLKETGRSLLDFISGLYLRDDLLSAGLKRKFWGSDLEDKEKWSRLRPHLSRVRNTTYYKVLETIFRDLYGIKDDLLHQGWETISSPVIESAKKGPAWYDTVLKKSNVELVLIDKGQTTDFEIKVCNTFSPESVYTKESPEKSGYKPFLPVLRIDFFAYAYWSGAAEAIEEKFGERVATFGEFEEFLKKLIPSLKRRGFKAIKSTLAYSRGLDFSNPDRARAEKAWAAGDTAGEVDGRCFQDYIVWLLSRLVAESGLTFMVHTGMLCCDARYPEKAGPQELVKLIRGNPETPYDLFHAGYPCIDHAAAMTKSLPNVYLNLNWLPVLAQETAERYVREILDVVPMTKVTWGGDSAYIEEVYAHAKLMKEILASVLAKKCESGRYDLSLCEEIATRFLRENARELYHI